MPLRKQFIVEIDLSFAEISGVCDPLKLLGRIPKLRLEIQQLPDRTAEPQAILVCTIHLFVFALFHLRFGVWQLCGLLCEKVEKINGTVFSFHAVALEELVQSPVNPDNVR